MRLARRTTRWGYDPSQGLWYDTIGRLDPSIHRATACWWIQAYGNMFQLFLYHLTGDGTFLDRFKKGGESWNRCFLDKKEGGAFLSCNLNGSIHDGTKATSSKTSYHSMEHCMLNYIYLRLWVEKRPVHLFFAIAPRNSSIKHYVVPIEDREVRIQGVEVDGLPWLDFNPKLGYVSLPPGGSRKLQVALERRAPPD